MAIAYVNGANSSTTATSLTYAVDCTGANILLVGFILSSGTPSTVTYNGVSMTQATSTSTTYVYYLVSPASGSNNVVITPSGSTTINSCAVCYSGAETTGQPDATNSASSLVIGSVSVNVTTVADNCWVAAFGSCSTVETLTRVSSGATRQSRSGAIFFDNNTSKTPAGSVISLFDDITGLNDLRIIAVSIKPSTSSASNSNMLAFFI